MFKGTANRPRVGQIAEELAALGAQSNAFTSQEFTGYWAKAEARKLPKILDIVSDLYLNPLFAPEEIEKERGVIIEEINMYEDMPMRKVQDVFLSLLYGDQPAGWDIGGDKGDHAESSRGTISWHIATARYVTPGTLVVVAGKFNEKAVTRAVAGCISAVSRGGAARGKSKTRESQTAPSCL